jgi:hypothetical protein
VPKQRGMHDQRLGSRVQSRRLVDGQREGSRYRKPVMILGRRMAFVVEKFPGRCLEPLPATWA